MEVNNTDVRCYVNDINNYHIMNAKMSLTVKLSDVFTIVSQDNGVDGIISLINSNHCTGSLHS